jgi:hypothetical protein
MADNLNMNGNQAPDANSGDGSINNAPSQSPLEQAIPAAQPAAPPDSATPGAPPLEPSASPFPPEAPAAGAPINPEPSVQVEAQAAPSIPTPPPATPSSSEVDMGQSATPPDTDEFLKSILQEQPQPQANEMSSSDMTTNQMPGENNPINQPLQEQTPVTTENPPLQDPGLNESPIGQAPPQEPAPTPMPTPPVEAPEASPPNMPSTTDGPKLNDNVSLGGIGTSPSTPQPSPTIGQDTPASPDVFAGAPQGGQGGSGLKKVIIGVLVLVVLAGGYYAYTMLGNTSKTPSNANKTAKSVTATGGQEGSQALSSSDTQRKADLKVIQSALIDYKAASSSYPVSATYTFLNTSGNIVEKALVPVYLNVLPQDPAPAKAYAYKSDGTTFTLTAELDNSTDPEAVLDNGKPLYRINQDSTSSSSSTVPAIATSVVSDNTLPGSNVDTAQIGTTSSVVSNSDSSGPPVPSMP